MTANIDPTPYVPGGIALGAIAGGLLYALCKLFEQLVTRSRARAAARRAAKVSHVPAAPPAPPAAPPVPQPPRDGVPARAITDVPTTAYHRTERP